MPDFGPLHDTYFADPFVLPFEGTYYAYGTGLHGRDGEGAFEVLSSPDLTHWISHGGALQPFSGELLVDWHTLEGPCVVLRQGQLTGPGHNSLVTTPDGQDMLAFHAWDTALTKRQLHIAPVRWTEQGPRVEVLTPAG